MDIKPKVRSLASKKAAKKVPKEKTQKQRFIEAARSIGVDETGKEFDAGLRKIVSPKTTKARLSG
ncbi:MAG: hypothetical protein ABI230_02490 [Aestuariivirga sp.]